MMSPPWAARTFGKMPEVWLPAGAWMAEWMTLDDETWFTRFTESGDPAQPPIVMVHGLIVSGSYFRPVAAVLERQYTIYVPDLPGYGRSITPRSWSLPSLTARLAAWMDAHALHGAILMANSLGCQIATLLAVTRPDLVRGMVLVAPTLDPDVRNGIHLMLRAALDVPRERQSLWSVWIPDLLRAGPRRALMMLGQTLEDGRTQLTRLPDVRQPTLLIGGERDPIVPPEWVHEMANRMPQARAMILPGCPHAMNYSSPRVLARAIDTVIQNHLHNDAG